MKQILKMFNDGNVCVLGERGTGKDMLFANVIARRNLDYIGNCRYDKKDGLPLKYYELDFDKLDCGGNTYNDFIKGSLKPYVYPYPLGVDVYITDVGVYLPSQYCGDLNKHYSQIPTFMALSRHLGECNVHINVQNLNRAWDKLREQSRRYITCLKCNVIPIFNKQLIIQRVRVYERAESCINNVPTLKLPLFVILGKDRMLARLYKLNYRVQHGEIKERTLIYFNQSSYDTHVFREMLKNAKGADKCTPK